MTKERLEAGKILMFYGTVLENIEKDFMIVIEENFDDEEDKFNKKELGEIIQTKLKIFIKTQINEMQKELHKQFNEL